MIVLNFPPDSLWVKKHSFSANELKDGFFNITLNALLKRIPGLNHFSPRSLFTQNSFTFLTAGDMRAQYGVTGDEVFLWIDRVMFWESSFGFRPADCYVGKAGNKQKNSKQGVLQRDWTSDEYVEVCRILRYSTFLLLSLLFPSFSCFCLCPFKVFSHNAHTSGALTCSLLSLDTLVTGAVNVSQFASGACAQNATKSLWCVWWISCRLRSYQPNPRFSRARRDQATCILLWVPSALLECVWM